MYLLYNYFYFMLAIRWPVNRIFHSLVFISIDLGIKVVLSHKNPIAPATVEAIKIAIFDWVISSGLSNASRAMKIDIVKPMPPRNPTPIICFQFKSSGNLQSPNETDMILKRKIPRGLPTISPTKIPMLFDCVKLDIQSLSMLMQVFAKANNGSIKNATGLWSQCCNL